MLKLFVGAAVLLFAGGLYMENESKEEKKRAKKKYKKAKKKAEKEVYERTYKAEQTIKKDQLYKLKALKQQVADTIYQEYKELKKQYKHINLQLKELKQTLNELFMHKRVKQTAEDKKIIQQNINISVLSRKKLFKIKEDIENKLTLLKDRLKVANQEIKYIDQKLTQIS